MFLVLSSSLFLFLMLISHSATASDSPSLWRLTASVGRTEGGSVISVTEWLTNLCWTPTDAPRLFLCPGVSMLCGLSSHCVYHAQQCACECILDWACLNKHLKNLIAALAVFRSDGLAVCFPSPSWMQQEPHTTISLPQRHFFLPCCIPQTESFVISASFMLLLLSPNFPLSQHFHFFAFCSADFCCFFSDQLFILSSLSTAAIH